MKKVLGLDLGSRTCGIAMSDILGMIAHGVETFRFKPDDYLTCAKHVKEIVEENDIETIIQLQKKLEERKKFLERNS